MHISRVEIENIKSHIDSTYQFSRGTTAITGPNGAGKTTLIEVVAWVLFDMLEYKKEVFLRRGTKKGSARVTIASSLDEREYTIHRDTGTGYYVIDPRLRMRVADKKDEVIRFLWQHLGLEPGTDLRSLFRQAIGVPQGTLTAIFLEGATERKSAFDRLLKVEEYRQAAEKLRETSRFVDLSVASIRESIARAEGELSRVEAVEAEYEEFSRQTATLSSEIEEISGDLGRLREDLKQIDALAERLSGLRSAVERTRAERERADLLFEQARTAHIRSSEAAAQVEASREAHERHLASQKALSELEAKRHERDRLQAELNRSETAMTKLTSDKERLERDLQKVRSAAAEIEALRPKAAEQEAIELQILELRKRIAAAQTAEERIRSIEAQLDRMREKYKANKAAMDEAAAKAALADELTDLETSERDAVARLATLRANLERDERFQAEIKNGLCPVLSEKCLNLKHGQTLDSFLRTQFTDMHAEVAKLETSRAQLEQRITAAREGKTLLAALETYRAREGELRDEGAGLNAKKAQLQAELNSGTESEAKINDLTQQLRQLADPAARIRVLEEEKGREAGLVGQLAAVDQDLGRASAEIERSHGELGRFAELDAQWKLAADERDQTIEGHRTFLANQAEANQVETRRSELENAQAAQEATIHAVAAAESDLAAAGENYDPEEHDRRRSAVLELERRLAQQRATFAAAETRQKQLSSELERFAELRKVLSEEFREKDRLQGIAEITTFIRDTLKEAAPRVARNYVHHVSLEANQMFREITGNGERTLKWADDYSIVLEEDGFERPFVSLSGGEQMSAALAVRLALLKQLSDINIAFFDEPTINMDAERRENFAQQISRITHFDQLFVITHDDTFDSYVDNIVAI